MKELNFYKKPFHKDKYISWVYDSQGNFVFQFETKYDNKGDYAEGEIELHIMNLVEDGMCNGGGLKIGYRIFCISLNMDVSQYLLLGIKKGTNENLSPNNINHL